jgi:drug/metabolite transporter (DMT)-like permease
VTGLLGVILALTSAVVWGSGDFMGGVATRRVNQYHTLALSAFSGLVLLAFLALARGEGWPSPASFTWAALGGVAGALGVGCLYRALSLGHAASVAPTTAIIAAALPVLVGALLIGLPSITQLAGFVVAAPGLWLVSRSGTSVGAMTRQEWLLTLVAGVGFGGFFVFIGLVERGLLFTPLIIARGLMLLTALALIVGRRLPLPSLVTSPAALLAGLLDGGGNIFYLLAKQYTRLDVAAVLASLYPAATVLLSYFVLKERIARHQWLGAALCLVAVALIAIPTGG